ncbi:MAG TPA: type IV pilus twitching motility protein PilT [Candidatus Paceibacterota bacterium]|nr:type IV pilus twitching motility protein PilT [Candidatus Paceibacterota bacterium]HRZ34354.1 type IV pilus twitching motility protein PilT [Candidatus Paceibacterota bacterium]
MDGYKNKLDELVKLVVQQGASDLHIAEGRKPIVRVSGDLNPVLRYEPFDKKEVKEILYSMLPDSFKERFEKEQQIDFSYAHIDGTRFRGNGFVQQGKIGIVMRFIPKNIRTLKELNLPSILETFARKKQGFFLVVGPVGQGKSTTLASMIELINQERPEHIITIEDPVEYIYQPKKSIIDQREVGIDAASFHSALVSTFRQDVDVILVGEMRDRDTMSAAVTAAETGHLVFSTLHTNNASQTIDRIIDSFPADQQAQIRIQLSSSLLGIFSQRLVPRISGGLIPVYELLINNNAVSNLIREKRTHEIDTIIETGSESGMIDMNRNLADLVRRGEITAENAFINSTRPKVLEKMI